MLSDKELIKFLWELLWNDLSDGDTPSDTEMDILRVELTNRGILDGEFPS
jgi:hypothetical protein